MVLGALPSSTDVQLVPAISSVVAAVECVVVVPFFRVCSLWLRLKADNLNVAIEHFGQFDTDKNGAIDIHELKQVNHGVPAYVRELAFQSIDVNRDGRITTEEFDEDAERALQEKINKG